MRRQIPKQPYGLVDIRLGMLDITSPKIKANRFDILQCRVPGSQSIKKKKEKKEGVRLDKWAFYIISP
jgi:hypothetical protein